LLHELTEGVPRRINVFSDRILLFGYLEEINFFTKTHIQTVADELADEITSPVKLRERSEIPLLIKEREASFSRHSTSINNTIHENKKDEIVNLSDEILPIDDLSLNFTQVTKPITLNNVINEAELTDTESVPINTTHIASGFADLDETIRDFESRVNKEIELFKQSLDKKFKNKN
jgi:hypothetical protein